MTSRINIYLTLDMSFPVYGLPLRRLWNLYLYNFRRRYFCDLNLEGRVNFKKLYVFTSDYFHFFVESKWLVLFKYVGRLNWHTVEMIIKYICLMNQMVSRS